MAASVEDGGPAAAPYGVGVDATGNVWMSNAGCNVTDCVPASFYVDRDHRRGAPTITPVSAQITRGKLVGKPPTN